MQKQQQKKQTKKQTRKPKLKSKLSNTVKKPSLDKFIQMSETEYDKFGKVLGFPSKQAFVDQQFMFYTKYIAPLTEAEFVEFDKKMRQQAVEGWKEQLRKMEEARKNGSWGNENPELVKMQKKLEEMHNKKTSK